MLDRYVNLAQSSRQRYTVEGRVMLVNARQAKSQLSRLIAAAEAGNDVIIARNGKPVVKLVPVGSSKFRFGTLAHLASTFPGFEDSLDEEELKLWEGIATHSTVWS